MSIKLSRQYLFIRCEPQGSGNKTEVRSWDGEDRCTARDKKANISRLVLINVLCIQQESEVFFLIQTKEGMNKENVKFKVSRLGD